MEPKVPFPQSQQPVTRPYPESGQSSPCPSPIPLLEDPFNIIFPSTSASSKWPPSLRFPNQTPYAALLSPQTSYMPHPSHSTWFHHPNNIGWGVLLKYHKYRCPTRYRTRHFFNNFTTNEDIATKLQTHFFSFFTQRTYSCSNFVAISSVVV